MFPGLMVAYAETTAATTAEAVTAAFSILTPALDFMLKNPFLVALLGASLIPVGFKIFKSAKRAAR